MYTLSYAERRPEQAMTQNSNIAVLPKPKDGVGPSCQTANSLKTKDSERREANDTSVTGIVNCRILEKKALSHKVAVGLWRRGLLSHLLHESHQKRHSSRTRDPRKAAPNP